MKLLTDKEKLPELRRRIYAVLRNTGNEAAVNIVSDSYVLNDGHSLHFVIQNKDYYFKGEIRKRV